MEDTNPKAFVFVLMPFDESFSDVYEVGIKPACRDAGAYCERVDEQFFDESILERVYNQISKADIIVAEMTGRNANVFYETGYAHALNKRVILLTKDAKYIPFDLKHFSHIVYQGKIAKLKTELEARIQWCIDNPKQSLSVADMNLEFFINRTSLLDHPMIPIRTERIYELEINIHNVSRQIADANSFSLALVFPKPVFYASFRRRLEVDIGTAILAEVTMPDGGLSCNLRLKQSILPDAWCPITLRFDDSISTTAEAILRLFTEIGPKDYPFTFQLKGEG